MTTMMSGQSRKHTIKGFLVRLVHSWIDHDNSRSAAAIGFYTLFSLAPTLFLSVVIASQFIEKGVAQQTITEQLGNWVTPEGAQVVKTIVENVRFPVNDLFASIISVGILLFGVSAFSSELNSAFNRILGFKGRSKKESLS